MAEFNPFAQLLNAQIAGDQARAQKQQNALATQLQQQKMDQISQEQAMEYAKALSPVAMNLSQLPEQQRAEVWPKVHSAISRYMPQAIEGLSAEYTPEVGQAIEGLAMWGQSQQQVAPKFTGEVANLANILGRKPTLEEVASYKSMGRNEQSPYFTPVQTSTGLYKFNSRTGEYTPMVAGEEPILPVSADVGLAGKKKGAEVTGKAEAEKKQFYPKAKNYMGTLERKWNTVDKTIDKALGKISWFTAGPGAGLAVIPGSSQKDLANMLNTIKANIGFDQLQQMRDASPTGGALGQVSEMENRLLQSVQGSLEQNQSPEQLIENLQAVKQNLEALRAEKRQAFESEFSNVIQPSREQQGQIPPMKEQQAPNAGGIKFLGFE